MSVYVSAYLVFVTLACSVAQHGTERRVLLRELPRELGKGDKKNDSSKMSLL